MEIDINKYETKPNSNFYCNVCLSRDRKLSDLGEFVETFSKICDVTIVPPQMVCWECKAILRKAKNFQQRALKAQIILSYQFPPRTCLSTITKKLLEGEQKDESLLIDEIPLSELKKLKPEQEDLKPEQDDVKPESPKIEKEAFQEIKKESTEYNDYDPGYDDEYIDTVDLKDIPAFLDVKNEIISPPVKKKWKKRRPKAHQNSAKYSYKWISRNRKSEVKVETIKISPEEVDKWIVKEKESDYYKCTNSYKVQCTSCVVRVRNEKGLSKHNKKYHNKKYVNKCEICLRTMPSKQQVDSHRVEHYQVYMCECGYQCYTREHMAWHNEKAHGRQVQCVQCEHIFSSVREFFTHFEESHNNFICEHCSKRCSTKNSIIKHMKKHIFPTKCSQCNAKFNKYRSYDQHMKIQHRVCRNERSYCVLCDRMFDNEALYRRHINSSVAHKHERNAKPRDAIASSCPVCGKVYSRRSFMMNHYQYIHLKKTKYYCAECDRYFLNSTRLKGHNRSVHLGMVAVRNKVCRVCNRAFSTNRILLHHMRTHTGERPHECQFCDAKFAQKYAMQTHIKHVHLNIKRKAGWQKTEPLNELVMDEMRTEIVPNQ